MDTGSVPSRSNLVRDDVTLTLPSDLRPRALGIGQSVIIGGGRRDLPSTRAISAVASMASSGKETPVSPGIVPVLATACAT